MIRLFLSILGVTCCCSLFPQSGIHNLGNLQLHQKGHLGFHSDFINDGSFENNLGLVGFYNNEENLNISGAFSPSFYDFELAVEDDLHLDIPININNSMRLIYGNIQSGRDSKSIYPKFTENSYYEGVLDNSKVDGYVAVEKQREFRFPVGHGKELKPLEIKFIDDVFLAKCAYFGESPDLSKSLSTDIAIDKYDISLAGIHKGEFWYLRTSGRVQISLIWNEDSNLNHYTQEIEKITVAGWSKTNNMWENLGNSLFEGDFTSGMVMSNIFNANDYEIYTFGFLQGMDHADPGNYALTPNGDGINDSFKLAIIDQSPNNELQIYNRAGLLVFEKKNYRNEFKGIGNRNIVLSKNPLPKGVYFYLLDLKDLNRSYQGYFYLATE